MQKRPRILVAPLNWGLGHATRCIPIIRELARSGAEVIIAADDPALILLKEEFPEIKYHVVTSSPIRYPVKGNMALSMIRQIPRILLGIVNDHIWLNKLVASGNIDTVISDNRYGMWNKKIHSVFITHQLMVKCPAYLKFLEPVLYCLNRLFIRQYDECWIPDIAGDENLSGDLSHKYPLPSNGCFIGWLSRLSNGQTEVKNIVYDLAILLSGPEPQRTLLERIVTDRLAQTGKKIILIRGLPARNEGTVKNPPGIFTEEYSHLPTPALENILLESEMILARPGYSTVMDMAALKKKVILVPTPGQTEQEYLADYLNKQWGITVLKQEEIEADKIFNNFAKIIPAEQIRFQEVKEALKNLLEKL